MNKSEMPVKTGAESENLSEGEKSDEMKKEAEALKNEIENIVALFGNGKPANDEFTKTADALQKKMGDLNFILNMMRREYNRNNQ
jgi:hypothetical protein